MITPTLDRRTALTTIGLAAALPTLEGIAFAAATGNHAAVKALLDTYVANKKVAGAVAAIGGRSGAPDFISAGRIATDAAAPAAGPDSLWRVYSMTKPITGIAAMLLIEDGKLELDTPIGTIFPGFRTMRVLIDPTKPETRAATTPITVRHLLTHTSGFVYGGRGEGPLAEPYNSNGLNAGQTSLKAEATARRAPNLIAFGEAASKVPLVAEPGTAWNYGISLDILGAVIEKVSGMKFERFLQTRIFDILGMADTGFVVPAAKLARFATNYDVTPSGLTWLDGPPDTVYARTPNFPAGGAGLVSSARDYARFTQMLLNQGTLDGKRVMKPETAKLAMSNIAPKGAKGIGNGGGYGAGGASIVTAIDGPALLGKIPGTYGWAGAAGTVGWVDPTSGFHAVLMTQYMPMQSYTLQAEYTAAIFKDRTA